MSVGNPSGDPLGVLKDTGGVELPPPARKTIDAEGRLVKDGVRKALTQSRTALEDLVRAVRQYRTLAEKQPLTLQEADYAHAVRELNTALIGQKGYCNDCPRDPLQ
jgi:hypothetical protein